MFYINLFFVYSILGHLLEKAIFPHEVSGILYGFWTPIYGFGSLFMILTFNYLKDKLKSHKILKLLATFLIGMVLLTTIEFIGGYLIEKIFKITFWDYSNMKYHIGKYASLEMGLVWGIASIILNYVIHPFLEKIIKKIPRWVSYFLIVLFIIDNTVTFLIKRK